MKFSIIGVHDRPLIRQFIEQRLLSYLDPGFGLYALVHKQDRELIGYCGFFVQQIDDYKEVEIGYRLATKYWGQGLATEAAHEIYKYGREKFKIKRFVCLIEPKNQRSIRVAKKLGMTLSKEIIYYNKEVQVYSINY